MCFYIHLNQKEQIVKHQKICYIADIARLAQLVERHIDVVDARGSNPLSRTSDTYEYKLATI